MRGETEDNPITLYDDEGIIILSDRGVWYTNQTGGVCCLHPVAFGVFIPFLLPTCVKRITSGRCCYLVDKDFAQINDELKAQGFDWVVTGGDEAWLFATVNGREVILVSPNSD